jgi:hypothetical protein
MLAGNTTITKHSLHTTNQDEEGAIDNAYKKSPCSYSTVAFNGIFWGLLIFVSPFSLIFKHSLFVPLFLFDCVGSLLNIATPDLHISLF